MISDDSKGCSAAGIARRSGVRGLLAVALLFVAAASAAGRIEYAHVVVDDRPLIEMTQPFGFGSRGHMDIELRDISLWRRHGAAAEGTGGATAAPQLSRFGFILASMLPDAAFMPPPVSEGAPASEAAPCALDAAELKLFTFADPKVEAVVRGTAPNVTFHVEVNDGGLFSLYFVSCEPGTPVSLRARVAAYNLVGPTGRRDYLSVGEGQLDTVYWIMFGLFSAITVAWALLCIRRARMPSGGGVAKLHWLMLALVACKTATLLAQAVMWLVVERAGSPHGWNWVYYAATFLRGLLFFVVLVLIGTGWSYMRPFVDERTRRVLLVVIPLQVLAETAIIVTGEASPSIRDWASWVSLLHLVDVLCCCAILFPIVWSIRSLRDAADTDGKAARSLERLTLFRHFYVVVVAFIYFTRIVVFLLRSNLEGSLYAWTAEAANELAYLAFYVYVGSKFRPGADSAYARLHSEEEVELVR